MKQRSIVHMIIWSIITLGIYQLFWLYETKEEMKSHGNNDLLPVKLLFVPIFGLSAVALIQLVVHFVVSAADTNVSSSPSQMIVNILSVLIGIVAVLAIIPVTFYWFYKYCQAIEKVTSGQLTFTTSYVLVILLAIVNLGVVWPFIVQSYFNKVGDGTKPNQPQPFPPAPVS